MPQSVINLVATAGVEAVTLNWDAPAASGEILNFESGALPSGLQSTGVSPARIVDFADSAKGLTKALAPAVISHNQTAGWTLPLEGTGPFLIRYQHETESQYDWVTMTFNGNQIYYASGLLQFWNDLEVPLQAPGTHTLAVSYSKDSSDSRGYDSVYVSSIEGVSASYAGGYEYRIDGGVPVSVGTSRSATITGLTPNQIYTFEVRPDSDGSWTSTQATPLQQGPLGVAGETSSAASLGVVLIGAAVSVTLDLTAVGVLEIASEGISVAPVGEVVILDPEIDRAPGSISIVLAGATPESDVEFWIDGQYVWGARVDSDGNLGVTSIGITATLGGQAGPHTFEVRQLPTSGGFTIASADYLVLNDPATLPAVVGADQQAIEVPGAVRNGVRYFVFQDLLPVADGGIGSYVLPQNPAKMTSPHYELQTSARRTTASTGQYHVFQGGSEPKPWTLEGYTASQEMLDKFQEYRHLNRRFYIIDHRNRAWKVILTEFSAAPRLRHVFNGVQTDIGSDYTITALILDQNWVTPA